MEWTWSRIITRQNYTLVRYTSPSHLYVMIRQKHYTPLYKKRTCLTNNKQNFHVLQDSQNCIRHI